MIDDDELRNEISRVIFALHRDAFKPCCVRWRAWRPDYEEELRRRRFKNESREWLRLKPCRLGDPHFFFKSMANTQREVFGDIVKTNQMWISQFVDLRNRVVHGDVVTDADLSMALDFANHLRKCLGVKANLAPSLSTVWPPNSIPPPPTSPIRATTPDTSVTPENETPDSPPEFAEFQSETMADGKPQVLTCYVVCDRSDSMLGEGIQSVNSSLEHLHRSIASDPVIADKCQIAVMSFSSRPQVVLPLTNLSQVSAIETIDADGITNYGAAFTELRRLINADLARLSTTHRPLRPIVFFITDGAPTDDGWEQALSELVDAGQTFVPSVIVIPVAPIPPGVIATIRGIETGAPPRVHQFVVGQTVKDAVRRAIESVTRSVIASATSNDGDVLVLSGLELQDA